MIERAIILKIQKEQPNVQLFIKLILMLSFIIKNEETIYKGEKLWEIIILLQNL